VLPRQGLDFGLFAAFTDSQFSDQANTVPPSSDGTRGVLPRYWVVDATARWRMLRSKATAIFSINNILDETYIASRAPRGTFPGAGRHFFAGVEMDI